ncbi:hypothetical protein BC833DRAFT_612559 [Globomyces pollinis-pini]|nr:hypothetical protein BC833DRAFT_612559 [Globomyces pollinis-pini]
MSTEDLLREIKTINSKLLTFSNHRQFYKKFKYPNYRHSQNKSLVVKSSDSNSLPYKKIGNKLIRIGAPQITTSKKSKPNFHSRKTNYCSSFKFGKCTVSDCPFIHDTNRIAPCPSFLSSNECLNNDCNLNHSLNDKNTPLCSFYERGCCNQPLCNYLHIDLPPNAPVCSRFAKSGYCNQGKNCLSRHVFVCPDFDASGECSNPKCKLRHVQKRIPIEKIQQSNQLIRTEVENRGQPSDGDDMILFEQDSDDNSSSPESGNLVGELNAINYDDSDDTVEEAESDVDIENPITDMTTNANSIDYIYISD